MTPENEEGGWMILWILAHLCGWIYFTAWTISFYPQLIINYQMKSTEGLSYTFAFFNLLGFIALAVYDLIRYHVQSQYSLLHAVEIQDVCFAVHAVLLCVLVIAQVIYYDREWISKRVHWTTWVIGGICIAVLIAHIVLVEFNIIPLTTYPLTDAQKYPNAPVVHDPLLGPRETPPLYRNWTLTAFCGALKLAITLYKYLPQIILNIERQMTNGMAIWAFNLDLVGGIFSLIQNGLEAVNHRSWTYVTGNVPKIGIALVGLTYNFIILGQHYYLYRTPNQDTSKDGGGGLADGEELSSPETTSEAFFESEKSNLLI